MFGRAGPPNRCIAPPLTSLVADDTVVVPSEDDLVGELADAEVFFGYHTPEIFSSARNLKWIHQVLRWFHNFLEFLFPFC